MIILIIIIIIIIICIYIYILMIHIDTYTWAPWSAARSASSSLWSSAFCSAERTIE